MGDLAGLPEASLAVLPRTSLFLPPGSGVLDRYDWLLAMIPSLLDAPLPTPPDCSCSPTAGASR
jgi:hypothetical protein